MLPFDYAGLESLSLMIAASAGQPATKGALNMKGLKFWFAMLVLIGPIHMCEQLLLGLDQLAELKAMAASYYARFDNPEIGTWLLVVIGFTLVQSLLLAMLAGGRSRLLAAGLLGTLAVAEGHHLLQSLLQARYFPGLITSVPFMAIGIMVVIEATREWRALPPFPENRLAAA